MHLAKEELLSFVKCNFNNGTFYTHTYAGIELPGAGIEFPDAETILTSYLKTHMYELICHGQLAKSSNTASALRIFEM